MSERGEPDLGQQLAEVEDLQANADAAAGHVRNIFFFFLTFGLYIAVTIGATTHEQLLRESPVQLPILNVEIPLFGFYWIAPALFVGLTSLFLFTFPADHNAIMVARAPTRPSRAAPMWYTGRRRSARRDH